MANPPPGLISAGASPNCAANASVISIARVYGSSSKIGDPRWKWRPTRRTLPSSVARATAAAACPVWMANPNLLSRTPVVV